MWFKNLHLLRFTQPLTLDPEQLDAQLQGRVFRPVGPVEPATTGWTPPLGDEGQPLVHAANGYIMLCARREERILPAAAVREVVEARAGEMEEKSGRKVRGKARTALRDEVIMEMLPRAFTRTSRTYAYIDPAGGWLVIDASSPRKAEEFTTLLRQSLDSLPVEPPPLTSMPAAILTAWLQSGRLPAGFSLGEECDLRDPGEDGGIVRVRRHDLGAGEIAGHLEAGKQASRLALGFEERLSFVVDENLAVRRLKFLDVVQEEAALVETETAAELFDSDFSIMTLELSRLLPRLVRALGGEADSTTGTGKRDAA